MRTRQYKHDPQELLKEGLEIIKSSADIKYAHRVTLVNLILSGMNASTLSAYCGESVRTLQTWVQKVDEKGWQSLFAVKQTGRPKILSETQEKEIYDLVANHEPEEFGYQVWDGPTVSAYIKSTYELDYGVRACQKLFHKLGLSQIRPQTYPSLENPDEQARDDFKKN